MFLPLLLCRQTGLFFLQCLGLRVIRFIINIVCVYITVNVVSKRNLHPVAIVRHNLQLLLMVRHINNFRILGRIHTDIQLIRMHNSHIVGHLPGNFLSLLSDCKILGLYISYRISRLNFIPVSGLLENRHRTIIINLRHNFFVRISSASDINIVLAFGEGHLSGQILLGLCFRIFRRRSICQSRSIC